MSPLEARYRRLLAWYPADHRAVHEDEMVGVLLAGAEAGQTRPGVRDRADLLLGAGKLHARRAFGRGSMGRWRDSAAVVAAVGTVLVALRAGADAAARAVAMGMWSRPALTLALAIVLLLGIVAGSRLVAVPAAGLLVAYILTSWMPWLTLAPRNAGSLYGPSDRYEMIPANAWALLPIVAGVAVALAGRPRRGLAVIGVRRLALWTGLAAVTMAWAQAVYVLAGDGHTTVLSLPFLAVCAAAAALALRSAHGRRAALVFVPLLAGHAVVCIHLASVESPWPIVALLGIVPALVFGGLGWWQLHRHGRSTTPRADGHDGQLADAAAER